MSRVSYLYLTDLSLLIGICWCRHAPLRCLPGSTHNHQQPGIHISYISESGTGFSFKDGVEMSTNLAFIVVDGSSRLHLGLPYHSCGWFRFRPHRVSKLLPSR